MTAGPGVVVEADGGSRGNPGPAGYGAVVLDAMTGAVLAERSEFLGVTTNNVAEYGGLIAGLQAARDLGAHSVAVRMDSKLVVEQMNGTWQVKHPGLQPLAGQARELAAGFDEITFTWIPRAQNTRADRLANQAMDSGQAAPRGSWSRPAATSTRFLLMRHGTTAHSHEGRFSGHNDLELDEHGRAQAAALAARATTLGDVAAVLSSPILRTRQTAALVGDALGLPVEIVDGFAEVNFGEWDGMSFRELRAAFPEEMAAWYGSPDVAPPGGESMAALAVRVETAREEVLRRFPDGRVVIVTHVSPIKALVRDALQAPVTSFYRMHLDTASLSVLDYFADGAASLRLFNDTSHLAGLTPPR